MNAGLFLAAYFVRSLALSSFHLQETLIDVAVENRLASLRKRDSFYHRPKLMRFFLDAYICRYPFGSRLPLAIDYACINWRAAHYSLFHSFSRTLHMSLNCHSLPLWTYLRYRKQRRILCRLIRAFLLCLALSFIPGFYFH